MCSLFYFGKISCVPKNAGIKKSVMLLLCEPAIRADLAIIAYEDLLYGKTHKAEIVTLQEALGTGTLGC